MATPVCKDCIQAAALDVRASSSASPCDGLIVNFTAAAGRTGTSETVVLKPVDNPSSVLGYDFVFDSAESGDTYNLILSGGQNLFFNQSVSQDVSPYKELGEFTDGLAQSTVTVTS